MSASMSVGAAKPGTRLPWGDILLSAIAAVSWALIGMAGTAALGLHLLGADTTASLGPMTAAVVALGAGGSVTPSGDVSAFGLSGAQAATAIEITPLGVGLVGALLLSWFFLRSLRTAGVVIAPSELLARAGAVIALFVAMLGGLAWAGHDVITIDGSALGLDDLPGGSGGGGVEIPGVGDIGDIGGLLPDRIGDLVDAQAAVGFTVDTAPTLLGGLGWCAGVLLIALLASRRTPLPHGWEAVHRVVRPAASALVTVLLMAVAAGFAAAAYAAIGDDNPKRIAGAALLGAPNGVWLGIPIGLFVPFDGRATGVLTNFLPDPLDRLLNSESDQSVTLGRLAELDGRVWLLGIGAAMMMLLAGVLTAVRTPVAEPARSGARPGARPGAVVRDPGAVRFAGRCALRLGVATALAMPLLAWLTEVAVDASLSVLGFNAFGAGIKLDGNLGMALLLGALWGAVAGAAGALLARATGAAGQRTAALALGDVGAGAPGRGSGWSAEGAGEGGLGAGGVGGAVGPGYGGGAGVGPPGGGARGSQSGPYSSGSSYRPPNPATNPYLRMPEGIVREPEDARPPGAEQARGGAGSSGEARSASRDARSAEEASSWPDVSQSPGDGMYGAPTVARPVDPPPRSPHGPGRMPEEDGPSSGSNQPAKRRRPPPPPPSPPPPAPRGPKGRR
ncbi:streptophobe family protein [Streptomyces lincolnensis]|nr:streptophobe family protein [Streptomyces lincolnensis]QMV06118.1 hypothetical protein GJU35_10945 [Streptomyces lincolnensis]